MKSSLYLRNSDVDVSDEDVLAGIREVFSEFTPAQCEELLSNGKVAFQDTLICTCWMFEMVSL